MRILHRFSLLLIIMLALISYGACAPPKDPGAPTPKELLSRASAGYRNGNRDEIARCYAMYANDPKTAEVGVDLLLQTKDVQGIVIDGVKKYGVEEFGKALGFGRLVFGVLVPLDMHFDLMIAKGTLSINGNKATYEYKVSEKGDELFPKQPELLAYDRYSRGNSTNRKIGLNLEKVGDRWYLPTPRLDPAQLSKVNQGLKEYFKQVRAGITASKDATALATALAEPNQKLKVVLEFKTTGE